MRLRDWLKENKMTYDDFAYYAGIGIGTVVGAVEERFKGRLIDALKIFAATGGEVKIESLISMEEWAFLHYLLNNFVRMRATGVYTKVAERLEKMGNKEEYEEYKERAECFRKAAWRYPDWKSSQRKEMALCSDFPWTLVDEKGERIPETAEEKEKRFFEYWKVTMTTKTRNWVWRRWEMMKEGRLSRSEDQDGIEALQSFVSFMGWKVKAALLSKDRQEVIQQLKVREEWRKEQAKRGKKVRYLKGEKELRKALELDK